MGESHEHVASVYVRCPECLTWGIPTPDDDQVCGNCGRGPTTPYLPSCCVDELMAERDEARGGTVLHQCADCGVDQWAPRRLSTLVCGACTHQAERDRLAAENAALRAVVRAVCIDHDQSIAPEEDSEGVKRWWKLPATKAALDEYERIRAETDDD